jgi:hypothetical protein
MEASIDFNADKSWSPPTRGAEREPEEIHTIHLHGTRFRDIAIDIKNDIEKRVSAALRFPLHRQMLPWFQFEMC